MSTQSLTSHVSARPRAARAPFLTRLVAMLGVRRERRALGTLDSALLRDIGITASEARREAARPAWDLPVRPF
ncbi:DUF1127 domain-containing protein [Oceanicola sp. S124]|uniref:DUF1127 domain-containing protein n=1 Tax=Oceanicola sp. S124 TaxID=1042378 RepID=UPI0002559C62|nr:DUF1127 domain-containing protein [Oceanicola sp. S124]